MTKPSAVTVADAYRTWQPELVRFLRRRVGSESDASDLAQESFVRWLASGENSTVLKPRAFLYQVARNLLRDRWRRRKTVDAEHLSLDQGDLEAYAVPSERQFCPATKAEQGQILALLAEAIDELPERQRQVFILHRFDGLTQEEIAERLGISRRMVVKHIARALAYCELRTQHERGDIQNTFDDTDDAA